MTTSTLHPSPEEKAQGVFRMIIFFFTSSAILYFGILIAPYETDPLPGCPPPPCLNF